MDTEFLPLAREAVTAMQRTEPNWAQAAQVWVTAGVGLLQCGLIAGGLWMMKRSGDRRDRALDMMEAANRKQGEEMTEAVQGLRQQGEVLAELLRRTA